MNVFAKCFCVFTVLMSVSSPAWAAKKKKNSELKRVDREFFVTPEARRIGDQLLLFQRETGGWPKNIDMVTRLSDEDRRTVEAEKGRRDDSTTDNGATTLQMAYLARLYAATGDTCYRDAFRRGVDYLLAGQYPNGGWPQFWPVMRDYQIHITYNDNAMVNTMTVIRDLMYGAEPYDCPGLLPDGYRRKLLESFYRGVECILATQIRDKEGNLTVWCQQHDRETYAPAPARSYELPSYCSNESAAILRLLMEIPKPDERVRRAVHAGMKWLDEHKIMGYRYTHVNDNGEWNATLVADSNAGPLWARFYDLENAEPYVCDRDGIPRRHLEDIGHERRNGYGWYSDNAASLYPLYEKWKLENK